MIYILKNCMQFIVVKAWESLKMSLKILWHTQWEVNLVLILLFFLQDTCHAAGFFALMWKIVEWFFFVFIIFKYSVLFCHTEICMESNKLMMKFLP